MRNEPAFPVLELNHVTGDICYQHFGITLRDYFAAKAMSFLVPLRASHKTPWGELAASAYEMADAMIAERDKGETK